MGLVGNVIGIRLGWQGADASVAHKSAQSIYCILAHLIAKAFGTAGCGWRMTGAWLVWKESMREGGGGGGSYARLPIICQLIAIAVDSFRIQK